MTQEIKSYELWKNKAVEDNDLQDELQILKDQDNEIYERFYKDLEFGTAGLRGIIGAGTNRMNIYTVRKATQGLANYLNNKYKNPSVAISFDSRIKSDLFSKEAASVLAANDILVYIAKELNPVPFLSFSVRELDCSAGIMITASHNPFKYNGYKCYGSDGCQITENAANEIYENIKQVDIFKGVKTCNFKEAIKSGKIKYITDDITTKYLDKVKEQAIQPEICEKAGLKVVYTPLNGSGNKLVRQIFKDLKIKDVYIVKEQELPDGNFPTCPYPNPEEKDALKLAINLAKEKDADLVIATDPDSDRIGIAVKDKDDYRLMTGNEVGIMLTEYLLSQKEKRGLLSKNSLVIKTIVSTELIKKITDKYNCKMKNVLTGFKYIGEQIALLEEKGHEKDFIFGFEESYGYLSGTYVRDKDGVVAAMLICEMACYFKSIGKTLVDFINDLYNEYGYYKNTTLSCNFEGATGLAKMKSIMDEFRRTGFEKIASFKVLSIADYLNSFKINLESNEKTKIDLPKSNVLAYYLENGNKVIIRPSGTEPKIKVYVTAVESSLKESEEIGENIIQEVLSLLNV